MQAIGRYLVIEKVKDEEEVSSSGLLITQQQKHDVRYLMGKIVSCGNYVEGLKDGDFIYYDKAAGFGVEVDKKPYLVIKESDVVIVL